MNSRQCDVIVSCLQLSFMHALTSEWLLLITCVTVARSTTMVISRNITGNVPLSDRTELRLDPSVSNLLSDRWLRIH